ncbi:MAG: response regulator [Chitinophagaceae bacterium]
MPVRHILLIDDDEDDHEIFVAALKKTGLNVKYSLSSDARHALGLLLSGNLQPDLILLDLNMPVMNGQQFLVAIKKEQAIKEIPVIILSTSSHQPTIDLTRDLGAKDFITKPDKLDGLISALKKLLSD